MQGEGWRRESNPGRSGRRKILCSFCCKIFFNIFQEIGTQIGWLQRIVENAEKNFPNPPICSTNKIKRSSIINIYLQYHHHVTTCLLTCIQRLLLVGWVGALTALGTLEMVKILAIQYNDHQELKNMIMMQEDKYDTCRHRQVLGKPLLLCQLQIDG